MPFNPFSPGMPLGPLMPRNPIIDQPPTPQPGVDPNRGYAQSPSGPQGMSMQSPTPLQPPTNWMDQLQKMLRNATTGLDPARTGIQGMFGQQQPRTTQTTDPGAGYGMSPSGPTAQMPTRQPQPQQRQPVTYMERGGSPYRGQEYTSPSHPRYAGPTPRDNVTETTNPGRGYSGSPSNPNWQPRKPMSPLYEPPRPPVGGP